MIANVSELELHLIKLQQRFLPDSRLEELNEPDDFEKDFDARAYLVLAHSAFEQFFEDTAMEVARTVLTQWLAGATLTKQAVATIASLTAAIGDLNKILMVKRPIEGPQDTDPRSIVSRNIREAFVSYRQSVIEENHGTDLHYLRAIFTPIGVNVAPTPDAQSALTHISNARGAFAHRRTVTSRGKFAYQPISAKRALTSTQDLLRWCAQFEKELALALHPPLKALLHAVRVELVYQLSLSLRVASELKSKK